MTSPQNIQATRRRVLMGAAWAVPVVTVASAAPAFAASTDWSATVVSLSVAPAVGTINGQANLPTNTTFNTFVSVRNDGPATAPAMRAQVTFPEGPIPNEFVATGGWAVESVTFNTQLSRWLVNCVLATPVASGALAPQLVVQTRTRLDVAFEPGQNGPFEVLARTYGSDGAPETATPSDFFYVTR